MKKLWSRRDYENEQEPLMSDGMRAVIIHNHIFKNAGSTIDYALHNFFGEDFVDHRDDESMRRGAAYLGAYLSDNKHIKALSSHCLTRPLPQLDNIKLMMIMMLRHPIERVTSVYNFERKQAGAITPGAIQARRLNLKEYVLWRMRPEVGCTIRNFHSRKLLPRKGPGKDIITDGEMLEVMRFAATVELLGLVERFDESMVLFEHQLETICPGIDLSYKEQNVGQKKLKDNQDRIETLRAELGEEVFHLLMESNQRDLDLYAWSNTEFERRIARVPNFKDRLLSFEDRCRRHN